MTNSPSRPPVTEKRGYRSRLRKTFPNSIGRHLYAASTFTMLFVLSFAGAAHLFLNHGRPEESPTDPVPIVSPDPPPPELKVVEGVFERNQTTTEALADQGLSRELVGHIIESARPVYNLGRVKAGQPYSLRFTDEGSFRDFRYPVDSDRYLTVYHDVSQDRLVSVLKDFSYESRVEPVSAVIEASLFASVLNIGEQDQLALELADIFGSDIDFYTDIQEGDWFKVLIEKKYLDGRFSKYGVILAAAFNNNKKLLTGFRFEDEKGKPGYYAPDGKSLKKSFLKSPLKFARISSRFSRARMHPILRKVRPHLGVDYAASAGTPVQAVGSGIVTLAGYRGANGRMVRIRHSGGYQTMYLHLSRIAVKSGARVSQGQVIGYVGSTGLSTGPHLDFRVLHHGKAVNPLKVIFPPGPPVSANLFDRFAALRDRLSEQLKITDDELNPMP